MAPNAEEFLDRWHRVSAEKDLDALRDLLADDVTIGAPPYWQRLSGKDLVHHLLGVILYTIEGFTYYREWISGAELALEFKGKVDDLDLQGMDLITLDDDNRVVRVDVMIRPLNAVITLQEKVSALMLAFLEQSGEQ
jgi:hypothetical protein